MSIEKIIESNGMSVITYQKGTPKERRAIIVAEGFIDEDSIKHIGYRKKGGGPLPITPHGIDLQNLYTVIPDERTSFLPIIRIEGPSENPSRYYFSLFLKKGPLENFSEYYFSLYLEHGITFYYS